MVLALGRDGSVFTACMTLYLWSNFLICHYNVIIILNVQCHYHCKHTMSIFTYVWSFSRLVLVATYVNKEKNSRSMGTETYVER